jgi:ribosomal protein S18 acetylase RimI-like enzyme
MPMNTGSSPNPGSPNPGSPVQGFHLRDFAPETDREAVIALLHELNRTEARLSSDRSTERSAAAACLVSDTQRVREGGGVQLVAVRAGAVIGYGACSIVRGGPFLREDVRTHGYLETLVVAKAHRGAGIGSALLGAIEAHVAGRGLRSLALGHLVANEGAARLYERHGYRAHVTERLKWLD